VRRERGHLHCLGLNAVEATVEAWVRPGLPGTSQTIVGVGGVLTLALGATRLGLRSAGKPVPVSEGTWLHVACTFRSNGILTMWTSGLSTQSVQVSSGLALPDPIVLSLGDGVFQGDVDMAVGLGRRRHARVARPDQEVRRWRLLFVCFWIVACGLGHAPFDGHDLGDRWFLRVGSHGVDGGLDHSILPHASERRKIAACGRDRKHERQARGPAADVAARSSRARTTGHR